MYCVACGQELPETARFCPECGARAHVPEALVEPAPGRAAEPVRLKRHQAGDEGARETNAEPVVDQGDPLPENVPRTRPWVRYWARLFDIVLFAFPAGFVLGVIAPELFLEPGGEWTLGLMVLLAWAFAEAAFLSAFGTTPGKWWFRIHLVPASGRRFSFGAALSRSLKVWFRGLGMGLPLVTIGALILAWYRLRGNGITSWDREEGVRVEHGTVGALRAAVAIAFFVAYFFFLAALPAV